MRDADAKAALKKWPQVTTAAWSSLGEQTTWLRAQPKVDNTTGPQLAHAGTETRFWTQPDGLWIALGGSNAGHYADCLIVEVCGTQQNFSDKRARYRPSTQSLVLWCDRDWLTKEIPRGRGKKPRHKVLGITVTGKGRERFYPVRFLRVLYFLADDLYKDFRQNGLPDAHEFIARYNAIKSYTAQQMQDFLKRMAPSAQFYTSK